MPRSADGVVAVPPLPVLSVLLAGFGSDSVADTVALLSNEPDALIVAVKVMGTLAPEARLAMVQGRAAQPPPVTLVMVRCVGVSVTWIFVAVDGPALATTSEKVTDWPLLYGPTVVNVFTTETSADAAAVPPLPVLPVFPVLFVLVGSSSFAASVCVMATAPAEMFALALLQAPPAPEARLAMVQGSAAHPPPLTFVMVRLVGVSVTCTFVAVDGPAL